MFGAPSPGKPDTRDAGKSSALLSSCWVLDGVRMESLLDSPHISAEMSKYVEVEGEQNARIREAYIELHPFAYADICKMCIFAGLSLSPEPKKERGICLTYMCSLRPLDCL